MKLTITIGWAWVTLFMEGGVVFYKGLEVGGLLERDPSTPAEIVGRPLRVCLPSRSLEKKLLILSGAFRTWLASFFVLHKTQFRCVSVYFLTPKKNCHIFTKNLRVFFFFWGGGFFFLSVVDLNYFLNFWYHKFIC